MKPTIITSAIIFLILSSCNHSSTLNKQKPLEALEDNSSYKIGYSRGYEDLFEKMYCELADKTQELKNLEDNLKKLPKTKDDSTELYNKYNNKNESYYSACVQHAEQIKDTALKNKMEMLIAASLEKYKSKVLSQADLMNLITSKELALNDLHEVIKLTRTLPLIEKYQNENLPSTKPLENLSNQFDKIIGYADTLSKK